MRTVPESDPVTGWRLAGALWQPHLGLKFAHVDLDLASPRFGHYDAAECLPDRYPTRHRPHLTPAPDPDCSCGYHFVAELHDLLDWPDYRHRENPRTAQIGPDLEPYRDGLVKFWTVVTVAGWGRTAPAAPGAGDPPGTMRASHLALTGGVLLDQTAPGEVTELLTGAGLLIREVPDLDQLAIVHERGATRRVHSPSRP